MYVFAVYIRLARISIQPLKRHVHLTISRRNTCFWYGRPCVSSVRKMAKRTLKGFKEVSEVLNTQPVACGYIWSFLKTVIRCFLCFPSRCSSLSYSSISPRTSRGSGCISVLCLRFRFCSSLLPLRFLHNFPPF